MREGGNIEASKREAWLRAMKWRVILASRTAMGHMHSTGQHGETLMAFTDVFFPVLLSMQLLPATCGMTRTSGCLTALAAA